MVRAAFAVAAVGLLVAGCGDGGPTAPPLPGEVATVCTAGFCVDHPVDWEIVEETDEFVSFRHPDAPDDVLGTVGQVNMEGLVTAAGGEWPKQPDAVVRDFWSLIDDGDAELSTLRPLPDGSVETFGTFAGGRLWYRLIPVEFSDAVGVEVRGPNSSWSTHAELILGSVTIES